MLKTIEEAQAEVLAIRADYEAEAEDVEINHTDVVVSAAWSVEDDAVALELCRVELGYVPLELEGRLGKKDWLAS